MSDEDWGVKMAREKLTMWLLGAFMGFGMGFSVALLTAPK